MKNYLLTLSILALASLQANGIANESDSAPRKAAKETQSESSDAVAPIPHYWDSNSWESGSSESFWHKKNDSKAKTFPTTPHPAAAKVTIPGKNTGQTDTGKD